MIPDILMGDPGRLRQILINLLHNAIKFSGGRPQPGRVSVRAVLEHHHPMQATVAFYVQDNGIGMDAATRTQLFDAFVQADASTTRRFGGTGLGLAISAQLTELMGGDIEVLSEPGQGSEFRVCISFAVPDAATLVRPRAADADQADADQAAVLARDPNPTPCVSLSCPSARPREDCLILVAEDNAMNQEVIRHQLSLLGYAADIADNGRAALDRWRHGRYDLLLTDLSMPDMDGYELTAAIRRAEDARARLPIVALTANALKGGRQHCLAANMDDYLTKPVCFAELQATLERWLPIAAPPAPPGTLAEPGDGPPATLDPTVLPSLVGENPARLARFRQHYRRCAHQLAEELRADLASGDWTGVSDRAHQLKSASRAVGALALGEICDHLEQAGSAGDGEAIQSLALGFETNLAAVLSALPETEFDP
ncbi:ATP-binding protein [uncultured Thiocystis sp.]|uniref:ATP-binding protein n=1 Tax=uncultured Thiocystis sp. TaxID=1202134 RepID=UPI0025E83976|nr:ATP-binding protein [uncultured Thiocystis sp.]